MASLDGKITYINPELCYLLGLSKPEDSYGRTLLQYYPEHLHDYLENKVIPRVQEQGQCIEELELISKRGGRIPTMETFFLIHDEQGNPLYIADVITDISDRSWAKIIMFI